jgi:hypothetical protein
VRGVNRRSLFKALLAIPAAAVLAPLVPEWTDAMRAEYDYQVAARLDDYATRVRTAMELYTHSPRLIGREDISEMLSLSLKDVPPDAIYLLDIERMVPPLRFLWQEDSLTLQEQLEDR